MTSIQVDNAARKEAERSNRARERETERSNKAKERETKRSNKVNEDIRTRAHNLEAIKYAGDIFAKSVQSLMPNRLNSVGDAAGLVKLINDPKWYEVSPQITKDVASISAFQPTGTIPSKDDAIGKLHDEVTNTTTVLDESHRFAVAGYCHFSYMPSIGKTPFTTNNADAVNITAQNIYSYMRNQVSGSVRNYERADYMMYLLAIDAPLSYYAWMKRIYGLLNYANLYNKYLPKHILNDMNVDYMDLSNQIANFRGYINQFAVRINATLAIPSRMPYYARHQFLNTYMFSDSKSKKHQLYFFSPRGYFIWKIDPNNQATMLDIEEPWQYNNVSKLKLEDIVKFGNYILDTLLEEQDVGIMVGDTIKAFGDNELVKVPEVQDGYVVEIGTSDEILDQITNIKFGKKNLMGVAGYIDSTGDIIASVVGYDQFDSTVVAKHSYDFAVRQDVNAQRIYQPCSLQVELDFTNAPSAVRLIWDHGALAIERALVCNDGENAVELNFLTDDTSPERVLTSTRLTPTFSFEAPSVVRASGTVDYISVAGRVDACGSEVVLEGYTSVLYWDSVNNEARVATYEMYDGLNLYDTTANLSNGANGTGFDGEATFISDFDYHPCINVYHTIASGRNATALPWIRKFAKLWDRNVSTYIPRDTLANIHGSAIMGEFNLAEIGLTPKAKI